MILIMYSIFIGVLLIAPWIRFLPKEIDREFSNIVMIYVGLFCIMIDTLFMFNMGDFQLRILIYSVVTHILYLLRMFDIIE